MVVLICICVKTNDAVYFSCDNSLLYFFYLSMSVKIPCLFFFYSGCALALEVHLTQARFKLLIMSSFNTFFQLCLILLFSFFFEKVALCMFSVHGSIV